MNSLECSNNTKYDLLYFCCTADVFFYVRIICRIKITSQHRLDLFSKQYLREIHTLFYKRYSTLIDWFVPSIHRRTLYIE